MLGVLWLVGVAVQAAAGQNIVVDRKLCQERESHWRFKGKSYVFSGMASDLKDEEKNVLTGAAQKNYTGVVKDFGEAVMHCGRRCMELVSLETEDEWLFIKKKMEEQQVPFIWTSGHICDKTVSPTCLTNPSIQPRLVNGWYWSGSGQPISPTNKTPPGWKKNPWGSTGIDTVISRQKNPNAPPVPQPDNAEQRHGLLKKQEESCLALATGLWEDDTVWNDIACYHEKAWVCEENESLLRKAGL